MVQDQGDSRGYHFTFVPKKTLNILEEKTVKPYLKKWGLNGRILSQSFAFNETVEDLDMNKFLQAFFASPDVYPHLLCDPKQPLTRPLTKVSLTRVPCSLTDLQIFERLTQPENGVVLRKFELKQCLQTEIDGFLVADELRKLLLEPESNPLYSELERDEFLMRLFQHCCLGGMWCQYEDSLEPYLTVTKELYKSLVSVVKCSVTNKLMVRSRIFKVIARHEDGDVARFPHDPERNNNFAYVMVDPDKKYVTTLVHQAGWCEDK